MTRLKRANASNAALSGRSPILVLTISAETRNAGNASAIMREVSTAMMDCAIAQQMGSKTSSAIK